MEIDVAQWPDARRLEGILNAGEGTGATLLFPWAPSIFANPFSDRLSPVS